MYIDDPRGRGMGENILYLFFCYMIRVKGEYPVLKYGI